MDHKSIIQFVKKNDLIHNSDTIIIGLSGGPDSVFLLHFLKKIQPEYNLSLIAAHLDHEWRNNSADDVLFCKQLCKKLNIPFITAKASSLNLSFKNNGSKEALARTWRRHFLETVRKQYNGTKIALAHHEQDQQETFLIRLVRGSSLTGLAAMRPKADHYIRPLLQTSKADILTYLHTHGLNYVNDSTNSSEEYLRNRIRLNVIPEIQKADSRFSENFKKTVATLQETEDFLIDLTQKIYQDISYNGELCLKKFFLLDEFLQKRILMLWFITNKVPFNPSQGFLLEIQKFFNNTKSTSHKIHPNWMICKKQNKVSIEK